VDTSARYLTKTLAENTEFKKGGFTGRLPYTLKDAARTSP
jgi:hypothetical protein